MGYGAFSCGVFWGYSMKKENVLLNKIIEIFKSEERGKVLDLGCASGDYSIRLKEMGYEVVAADAYGDFEYKNEIKFKTCDITKKIPFSNETFDYVLFTEVVEHLRNPYFVMKEINRVLRKGGKIILSTPNVLNIKSRIRFLAEGAYEYYRESPLDQIENLKANLYQLHILPLRYHEMEFLLYDCRFKIDKIFTSIYENLYLSFIVPLIKFQLFSKNNKSLRKGGLDYSRINKILLSKEILFGRHLIIKASKM